MTVWLSLGGAVVVVGCVWWFQRWHQRQQEYSPESWTRRRAEKAWKK